MLLRGLSGLSDASFPCLRTFDSYRTLYDVFKNIMEDENEHVKTMTACRDYSIMADLVNKGKAKQDKDGSTLPPEDAAKVNNMDRTRLQ